MIVIKKVLNSSVVLVENEQHHEFIILGKGLGYGRSAGEVLADTVDKQVFIPVDNQKSKYLLDMLSDLPYELLDITQAITAEASRFLGKRLNENLYFMLADHLAFAIDRQKNKLHITNRVFWEIKNFYPDEFSLGVKAIDMIKERMAVELPEEEAANIAFHLVNAQAGNDEKYDSSKIAKLIGEVLNIVRFSLNRDFNPDNIHYIRFITHIKFFAERYFTGSMLENSDDSLYMQLNQRYRQEMEIARKVDRFIAQKYGHAITHEEITFLIIHINRIMMSQAQ